MDRLRSCTRAQCLGRRFEVTVHRAQNSLVRKGLCPRSQGRRDGAFARRFRVRWQADGYRRARLMPDAREIARRALVKVVPGHGARSVLLRSSARAVLDVLQSDPTT